MKYYIGDIETQDGNNCYSTYLRFKTDGDPDAARRKIASTLYGDLFKSEYDTFFFEGGMRATQAGNWQEVEKDFYDRCNFIREA